MHSEGNSLFLVTRHDGAAWTERLARIGWTSVATHRPGDAAARFLTSNCRIAMVNVASGEDIPGVLAQLAGAVESIGGALIAIIDPRAEGQAERLFASGATHFLYSDALDEELRLTVGSAQALSERISLASGLVPVSDGLSGARMADHDALTGLATRRFAFEWLSTTTAREDQSPLCVLVGLSQFDTVNAAYGQATGDQILRRVAARILAAGEHILGRGDLVARIAGTEFLVAIQAESEGGARLAERGLRLAHYIMSELERPFVDGERLIRVTARCGLAEGLADDDASRLLRRAAAALAEARKSGNGGICLRTTDRRGRGIDLDRLDADLRLALDQREIGVVFQPQYRMSRNQIDGDHMVGVEALARWNHPRLGELGAGILFDAAERSDFLLPLSRHIQREALVQAAQWPSELAALRLSVNVTAADLAQPDFVEVFTQMIADSGFPADRLTVEITETGLIENISVAAALLAKLRVLGLRVAIDDFGTGYSSLAYLKGLEIDYLKIDSGLTRDIAGAPRDRVIVRGIIALARALSLSVIAEGVENAEQLDLLTDEGCDLYQGFIRSPAIDSASLATLARAELA